MRSIESFEEALDKRVPGMLKKLREKGFIELLEHQGTRNAIQDFEAGRFEQSVKRLRSILLNLPLNTVVNFYLAVGLLRLRKNEEAHMYF